MHRTRGNNPVSVTHSGTVVTSYVAGVDPLGCMISSRSACSSFWAIVTAVSPKTSWRLQSAPLATKYFTISFRSQVTACKNRKFWKWMLQAYYTELQNNSFSVLKAQPYYGSSTWYSHHLDVIYHWCLYDKQSFTTYQVSQHRLFF